MSHLCLTEEEMVTRLLKHGFTKSGEVYLVVYNTVNYLDVEIRRFSQLLDKCGGQGYWEFAHVSNLYATSNKFTLKPTGTRIFIMNVSQVELARPPLYHKVCYAGSVSAATINGLSSRIDPVLNSVNGEEIRF